MLQIKKNFLPTTVKSKIYRRRSHHRDMFTSQNVIVPCRNQKFLSNVQSEGSSIFTTVQTVASDHATPG